MSPEVIASLATAAASAAALVGGSFADTWGFAVLLAVIAFLWFKAVTIFFGLLPGIAAGFEPGYLLGSIIGAATLGAVGQLARRSYLRFMS